VSLDRLSTGERISSVSAVLLFIFMFFHWFGVRISNSSNLLFAIQSDLPGKSAWEALDYIPILLTMAIGATLAATVLRLTNSVRRGPVNVLVAFLGLLSGLLIAFRIINPPSFASEGVIAVEGTVQFPIFLALLAAAGIAFGGYRAMREERRLACFC
jgi:uncharacterized protein YacL